MSTLRRKLLTARGNLRELKGVTSTTRLQQAHRLARAADLNLLRVDLSQVASKYIGETEKNLERVFDAAERAGALLYFDEADALFGKRTGVKDSHDRYANLTTQIATMARNNRVAVLVGISPATSDDDPP